MKNKIKNFCHRGAMFGGIGPIIYGIIVFILELSNVDTNLDGIIVFKAGISTYLLGFIVAGASIIWQEERLGPGFSVLIHGMALYISYLLTYLINGWIIGVEIIIFSLIFILGYLLIVAVIYFIEKSKANKLNKELNN